MTEGIEPCRTRPSGAVDLYDLARLADSLEHIHRFSNIIVATEITDLRTFDLTRTYAAASGTTKGFGMSCTLAEHMDELIASRRRKWRRKVPWTSATGPG